MKRISPKKMNAWKHKAWGISELKGFHSVGNPSNHNQLYAGVSEMGEFLDCVRLGQNCDIHIDALKAMTQDYEWAKADKQLFKEYIKETRESELADIVIWLLDLAGEQGYNFERAIEPSTIDVSDREKFNDACIEITCDILQMKYSINTLIQNVFMFAWSLDIDLELFVELKMKYNSYRPKLNGKKF